MSSAFHEILRAVASAMELPVVLLLVLLPLRCSPSAGCWSSILQRTAI